MRLAHVPTSRLLDHPGVEMSCMQAGQELVSKGSPSGGAAACTHVAMGLVYPLRLMKA